MPLDASSITAPPLQPQTAPNAAVSRDFPPTPFQPLIDYLATTKSKTVKLSELETQAGEDASIVMGLFSAMAAASMIPGVVNVGGAALLYYRGQIAKLPESRNLRRQQKRVASKDKFIDAELPVDLAKEMLRRADLVYRFGSWVKPGTDPTGHNPWEKHRLLRSFGLLTTWVDGAMLAAPLGPLFLFNNPIQGYASMLKLAAIGNDSPELMRRGVMLTWGYLAAIISMYAIGLTLGLGFVYSLAQETQNFFGQVVNTAQNGFNWALAEENRAVAGAAVAGAATVVAVKPVRAVAIGGVSLLFRAAGAAVTGTYKVLKWLPVAGHLIKAVEETSSAAEKRVWNSIENGMRKTMRKRGQVLPPAPPSG